MVKTFDGMTLLDKHDRMVGHVCSGEQPCYHCKAGVPFMYPSEDIWPIVSEKLLVRLERHALTQIEEASAALHQIHQQRAARA